MPPNNEIEHESIDIDSEEIPRRRKTKVFNISRSSVSLDNEDDIFEEDFRQVGLCLFIRYIIKM